MDWTVSVATVGVEAVDLVALRDDICVGCERGGCLVSRVCLVVVA